MDEQKQKEKNHPRMDEKLEGISKSSSLSLSSRCGGVFDPPKDSLLRELSSVPPPPPPPSLSL